MLNSNAHYDCRQCRIYRLLFLLILAVFAISPIVDAYQDSLCSSSVDFNELNNEDSPVSVNDLKLNDALNSLHALKSAAKKNHDNQALVLDVLAMDGPARHITKPQLPANDSCFSQGRFLTSSDPSPPLI